MAQTAVRFGIPPTESIPAIFQFALAFDAAGKRLDGDEPLADEASGAEHTALAPPCEPPHVHAHGPLPLTAEAVPIVHRFDALGRVLTATPLALPQVPFSGEAAKEAEHSTVDKQILIKTQLKIQKC